MNQVVGKWVIIAGCVLMIAGVVWYFFGDKLNFIGNLPGDIRIEKENFKFYFPFTTMILLSVLINVMIKLFRYFFT